MKKKEEEIIEKKRIHQENMKLFEKSNKEQEEK